MSAKFEVGKMYKIRMIGDADAVVIAMVDKRTSKTVTLIGNEGFNACGWNKSFRVKTDSDGEYVNLGSYSMAPVCRACREVA